MSVPITVAAFGTIAEAEEAVRKLIDGGVSAEIISLVAKDMQCEKQVHGFVTSCDVAKKAATGTAWLGGLFGVLAGAAVIWVPDEDAQQRVIALLVRAGRPVLSTGKRTSTLEQVFFRALGEEADQ